MNPSFHIRSSSVDPAVSRILIEAGPKGFSFVISGEDRCFNTVVSYSFPAGIDAEGIAENLKDIIGKEDLLRSAFMKANLVWSFPESILVPHEYFRDELRTDMLDLVYGDLVPSRVQQDFAYRLNGHNVYRVPETILSGLPPHILSMVQTHQFTLLPELLEKTGNSLLAVFYQNTVSLTLGRDGKLLFSGDFTFHDPEEAAYHVLNVLGNFGLPPDETTILLSGMIDADSNLYTALFKYFLNLKWLPLPEGASCTEDIRQYPAHFFSHLFAEALCV